MLDPQGRAEPGVLRHVHSVCKCDVASQGALFLPIVSLSPAGKKKSASNYKCLTSSNKKLLIRIQIKFVLLLVVRHLFLIANIVTTSKAPVTTSEALVLAHRLLESCGLNVDSMWSGRSTLLGWVTYCVHDLSCVFSCVGDHSYQVGGHRK